MFFSLSFDRSPGSYKVISVSSSGQSLWQAYRRTLNPRFRSKSSIRLMYNIARRGPASIAKSAYLPSGSGPYIRSIILRPLRPASPHISRLHPLPRHFSLSSETRQQNARAEAVRNEIADEVTAQRPPSDVQINQPTQYGPVTEFKQLRDRGMVCPTVVKTLTEDMGMETMTQVQSLTINETLKGVDV